MARNGVFCVEGQWDGDLRYRGSVLPTLQLLENLKSIKFVHKDVATPEELSYFLGRWVLKQYADYNVGFFAMHGGSSQLHLSDWHAVELADLGGQLKGKCVGKSLYFGSCSVLGAPKSDLIKFLRLTGASMICGYARQVDWVFSAAFETVLLDVLANGKKSNSVEQRMGAISWVPLASYLGFKIVYADGRVWRPDASGAIPRQRKSETVESLDSALVLGDQLA